MFTQPDTLEVIPDANAAAHAVQWLEAIAEREGWPPKTCFGMTLSLDEALTNIVSYAFAQRAPAGEAPAVRLSYRGDGPDLLVEIADNGLPHDPTLDVPPPLAASLDEAEAGGHGLRLMRHYLKDLSYRRDPGWNRLTLIGARG
jgi:anti-sigma regulatory factor (Ser/Thr protein kinase)